MYKRIKAGKQNEIYDGTEKEMLVMKRRVEELLKLAGDVNQMLSPSDRLSELIEATTARYSDENLFEDELFEDELELVAAARKVPDKPADGRNSK